ncbi:MAG: ArdC-like ssDNA-binding domain-containing protein [Bacteriovorax sp.]|nr:ArdC-like ssDNA-binding domain-containing protein [Bacteriovorax sp.]
MTIQSNWRGSTSTYAVVKKQIAERWSETEANRYDPQTNCLTFKEWLNNGYQVKRGEKALKSYTLVEVKNEKKEINRTFKKTVNLFYEKQVEPIEKTEI